VALGQFSLRVLWLSLSVQFHKYSILNFIFRLPEIKMGELKQCFFGNWGALNGNVLSFFASKGVGVTHKRSHTI
jgi:hypothetical protein